MVIGIDNLMYNNGSALLPLLGDRNFVFERLDARDAASLYAEIGWEADVILPLAALVGAPVCANKPLAAKQVNFNAVADLCDLMSPHQFLIYPNTNSGYGQTDGDRPCLETDPLNPISVYGKTKCGAEEYVLSRNGRSVVFRLATVFGASPRMRMDLMVNDFTRKLWTVQNRLRHRQTLEKEPLIPSQQRIWDNLAPTLGIFEPHFQRNFVHVRDVANAFCFAMESQLSDRPLSGVYNLGLPDSNMTKLELAHTICDVLGMSRECVTESVGKDPDQRNYIVSNDKILTTGFEFQHSLNRGIREVEQICRMTSHAVLDTMNNTGKTAP